MRKNKPEIVFKFLKKIPKGKVSSYGQLAKITGLHPRSVGQILKNNKNPAISCYKIIKSDGTIGGYNRGVKQKIRKLKSEGIKIKNGKIDKKYFYQFRTNNE